MPIFLTVFSFFLSFFFFMAALVYVIESRVVFHLLREKVEFTGYTTETMKMTTITRGMETLLNRCGGMIQDCLKYMES